MARFKKNQFSGILGNLVFRVVNGVMIVSTKKAKGTTKQTKETKRAGNTFGMAGALASNIMGCFNRQMYNLQDTGMYNRLSKVAASCLHDSRDTKSLLFNFSEGSFDVMDDFEYNINSPLRISLRSRPQLSYANGVLKVLLTGLNDRSNLKYPKDGYICEITAGLGLFRLQDGKRLRDAETQRITINHDDTGLGSHEFSFVVPNGCFCVVALSLTYFAYKHHFPELINNKNFSPAVLCKSFITPGSYQEDTNRRWETMDGLTFMI